MFPQHFVNLTLAGGGHPSLTQQNSYRGRLWLRKIERDGRTSAPLVSLAMVMRPSACVAGTRGSQASRSVRRGCSRTGADPNSAGAPVVRPMRAHADSQAVVPKPYEQA